MQIEGKKWTEMSPDEVKNEINDNSRVQCYDSNRTYYQSKLDKGEFLSLIWHEIDASRLLTPKNKSRTVQDVAQRMEDKSHTFESLSKDQELPSNQHDPGWFRQCIKIYNEFTYDKFGTMWLVLAKPNELTQSPSGIYYIHDGCHRSLVLGKLLREGEDYCPVKAILIYPRPD